MKPIREIMALGDPMQIYTLLTARKRGFKKPLDVTEAEYNPMQHAVYDKTKRKKRNLK